jgi:hypothetical protein
MLENPTVLYILLQIIQKLNKQEYLILLAEKYMLSSLTYFLLIELKKKYNFG